jgi:hypothetical protein
VTAQVTFAFAARTPNKANGSRGFSRAAALGEARRCRALHDQARAHTLRAVNGAEVLPCTVTLCRVAPSQGLDEHDGLRHALKHVVDGIAAALGLASDRDERITWEYDQRRGSAGEHAVEVTIIARPPPTPSRPWQRAARVTLRPTEAATTGVAKLRELLLRATFGSVARRLGGSSRQVRAWAREEWRPSRIMRTRAEEALGIGAEDWDEAAPRREP